jgi:hypothetical protein
MYAVNQQTVEAIIQAAKKMEKFNYKLNLVMANA